MILLNNSLSKIQRKPSSILLELFLALVIAFFHRRRLVQTYLTREGNRPLYFLLCRRLIVYYTIIRSDCSILLPQLNATLNSINDLLDSLRWMSRGP
ncbi:hypothetical protein F5B17DRAFT_384483 [Nemania serpens]|nr:hypothetical protein F5B17DRAFT_384483 [Nemania serpens]